jgi:hypothetical protein
MAEWGREANISFIIGRLHRLNIEKCKLWCSLAEKSEAGQASLAKDLNRRFYELVEPTKADCIFRISKILECANSEAVEELATQLQRRF